MPGDKHDNFYRSEAWNFLKSELLEIKESQKNQAKRLQRIEEKIAWMTGWAIGAGAISGLIISFLKEKLFK